MPPIKYFQILQPVENAPLLIVKHASVDHHGSGNDNGERVVEIMDGS